MGILGILKSEKINTSKLSGQIKPIYESAYAICREFGYEEGYFNYCYKNKNIIIRHSNENGSELNAFSPGKHVYVVHKGRCVFDCLIKLNGDIKLRVFETGDWEEYFSILVKKISLNHEARNKLSAYYDFFANTVYRAASYSGNKEHYSYCNGRIKVNANYGYYVRNGSQSYSFEDDKIKLCFSRDEKSNIASAAVITFKGKTVFDAIHYFPSGRKQFSSNTRCNIFIRGEWEQHLINLINNFKVSHGL